jgi:hypothetical protein
MMKEKAAMGRVVVYDELGVADARRHREQWRQMSKIVVADRAASATTI